MEKKIKIFVAAHKQFNSLFLPDIYTPIQVGAQNSKNKTDFLKDDTFDNISYDNSQFCELTGLYWGWKNCAAEISGLCHYRRYFIKKNAWHSKSNILDEKSIYKYLSKKKIIIPELSYRIISNPKLYKEKPKSEQDYFLVELEKIILEKYPEYKESWVKYTYKNKVSWGNMFISSKKIYDSYCSWVFPILFELEDKLKNENKLVPRLMGFLSEITMCVWIDHNFMKNEICYLPVINTEIKEKASFLKNILRKLKVYNLLNAIKFNIYYKKNNY